LDILLLFGMRGNNKTCGESRILTQIYLAIVP